MTEFFFRNRCAFSNKNSFPSEQDQKQMTKSVEARSAGVKKSK
jgi:hypothetical protein